LTDGTFQTLIDSQFHHSDLNISGVFLNQPPVSKKHHTDKKFVPEKKFFEKKNHLYVNSICPCATAKIEFQLQSRDRCCQCKTTFQIPQVRSFVCMVFRGWTGFDTEDMLKFDGREGEELQINGLDGMESLEVSCVVGMCIYKLGLKNSMSQVDVTFVMRPQTANLSRLSTIRDIFTYPRSFPRDCG